MPFAHAIASSIRVDGYGFERSEAFNFDLYNDIMSDYLVILTRRAAKWHKLWPSSSQRSPRRSRTSKAYKTHAHC